MQTYYSIISVPINTYLGEKISVGLVMYNTEASFLRFSFEKLSVIKELIVSDQYYFLKSYFKHLEADFLKNSESIFKENRNPSWINQSYISYLNRYSNNSIEFSEPQQIDIELSNESFRRLFEKYIFEFIEEAQAVKTTDIISVVKRKLYDRIEDKVNLNLTITKEDFSEVFTPIELNFVGKNGILVTGQAINFEKPNYYLESDLSRYIAFTQAANYTEKKPGTYYVIGKEPKKQHHQQHSTWKNIKDNHLVEYVDVSEVRKIEEYILEKGVQPFYVKNEASK